jgi:glutamine synthetase
VGIAKAVFGLTQQDIISPGFGPSGEYFLMPDLKSLHLSKLEERYAYVMGQFEEKEMVGDTVECELCPRTLLNRIVRYSRGGEITIREAKRDHDISFLVGFETEVVFLEDGIYPPVPLSQHAYCTSLAFRSSSVGKAIVEEVYDVLTDAGIEVQQFHAESAPGQYEIVTSPLEPLEAVDALVFTRDTIYNVAAKHGVRATLLPKVYSDACISPYNSLFRWNRISRPRFLEEGRDISRCWDC